VKVEDVMSGRCAAIESRQPRSIYDVLTAEQFTDTYVTTSLWSKLAENTGKLLYCPFLARDIMEYGLTIPWEVKLRQPKRVLRQLARALGIPEFVITRPKSGFGWETSRWAVAGTAFDALVPVASKAFDERALAETRSTDQESAKLFWAMLSYALWKRLCIDMDPLDTLHEELSRSLRDVQSVRSPVAT
jgi:asparagine synthetase B (glutamine-hydrolysing)